MKGSIGEEELLISYQIAISHQQNKILAPIGLYWNLNSICVTIQDGFILHIATNLVLPAYVYVLILSIKLLI